MKINCSKKLIIDYVNGEYIEYIDELENNYLFMMEVIKYSNDKNFYNLCSDEVKNNFIFVKFMIEMFKNDLDFIVMIVNNYLKNIDKKDITYRELVILMSNLTCKREYFENSTLIRFSLSAESFYIAESAKMTMLVDCEEDPKEQKELGLGYIYIIDNYGTSSIITDFFAKKMIYKIFFENETYNLEQLIHSEFNSFGILEQQGINNFLISYINRYDSFLASYVSCHIELLTSIRTNLNEIKNNWDCYIERLNQRKVTIYNYEITRYFEKYHNQLGFHEIELIDYVKRKLKLEDYFNQYDLFSDELEPNENFLYSDDMFNENNMTLMEVRCLRYAFDLANQLFSKDVIDVEFNDYDEEEEKEPAKIIQIDFSKKVN